MRQKSFKTGNPPQPKEYTISPGFLAVFKSYNDSGWLSEGIMFSWDGFWSLLHNVEKCKDTAKQGSELMGMCDVKK